MQLWDKFRPGQTPTEELGANRDWNIDLIPKFIMANGKLVHALLHTGVTRYMDFKAVDGSYVLNKGVVKKVPCTDAEALTTDLVGFLEKRRLRSFFVCASSRIRPRASQGTIHIWDELECNVSQRVTLHARRIQTCLPCFTCMFG